MATPAQTSPLERQRMANLRSSRSAVGMAAASLLSVSGPAPTQGYQDPYAGARTISLARAPLAEMPAAVRDIRQPKSKGPVFGEEGFGDLEATRATQPADDQRAEETGEDTDVQNERRAWRPRQDTRAQEASEEPEEANAQNATGTLSDMDLLARDQIDILVNLFCYSLPVLGHWLWWNLRMAYGSWIAGGNSKYIGPFGWGDVIMVFLPGGKYMGAGTAGKAVAQILPDFVAHLTLIFFNLLLITAGLIMLAFQAIVLYILYLSITDPIGTATQFGGLISSFF